jgi:ketosteroid isomerase-like protein
MESGVMAGHPNAVLLERLFTALDRHDHTAMAACYQPEATFRDIAFHLRGQKQIHGMWHMICQTDIRTQFQVVDADAQQGHVHVTDVYTFGAGRGRPVTNVIDSRFVFRDGLILEQRDTCDARAWARAALGGPVGFLAGHLRFLRSAVAHRTLDEFVRKHPQYR